MYCAKLLSLRPAVFCASNKKQKSYGRTIYSSYVSVPTRGKSNFTEVMYFSFNVPSPFIKNASSSRIVAYALHIKLLRSVCPRMTSKNISGIKKNPRMIFALCWKRVFKKLRMYKATGTIRPEPVPPANELTITTRNACSVFVDSTLYKFSIAKCNLSIKPARTAISNANRDVARTCPAPSVNVLLSNIWFIGNHSFLACSSMFNDSPTDKFVDV